MAAVKARINVEITPLRVLTWPGGRLDAEPEIWTAPEGTTAPPSDPAPRGRALAPRAEAPGGLAPVRRPRGPARPARPHGHRGRRLAAGPALPERRPHLRRLPAGAACVPVTAGPACPTAHPHSDVMDEQGNVVLLGAAEPADDGLVHLRVERALADWSITGSK